MMIFNQFAEMGNPLWHYNVTGYALADLFEAVKKPGQKLAGAFQRTAALANTARLQGDLAIIFGQYIQNFIGIPVLRLPQNNSRCFIVHMRYVAGSLRRFRRLLP